MFVTAVLNQKGGVGKTTVATHLATALLFEGLNSMLVNSDPQDSALDWASVRTNHPLPVVTIDNPTALERDVRRTLAHMDMVVIDGAPSIDKLAISAIKTADLIIIPVQPSPYDIWATAELVDMIKQRQEFTNGTPKACFMVSRAIKGSTLAKEVKDALEEYGFPVLESRFSQRVAFPNSATGGFTVMETEPNGEAAGEVRALVQELRQHWMRI